MNRNIWGWPVEGNIDIWIRTALTKKIIALTVSPTLDQGFCMPTIYGKLLVRKANPNNEFDEKLLTLGVKWMQNKYL